MLTLCIDTSSSCGVIALAKGESIVGASSLKSAERQGESLLPRIDDLLKEAGANPADLDLIGVALGPGGFTAVRVGLATAKGLCLARGTELVGVESLRVIARGFGARDGLRVPVRKAYRGEIFVAAYEYNSSTDSLNEKMATTHGAPTDIAERIRTLADTQDVLIGGDGLGVDASAFSAWEATPETTWDPTFDALVAEVLSTYRNNGPSELAMLQPLYIKPSDAKLPAKALTVEP